MARRTRKQKQRATERRKVSPVVSGIAGGNIYTLPKVHVPSGRTSEHRNTVDTMFVQYFKRDMMKTLGVCLVILAIIAVLWVKLR